MSRNFEYIFDGLMGRLKPVIVKYLILIVFVPFLVIMGYEGINYFIVNDIAFSYSNISSYTSPIFVLFFILNSLYIIFANRNTTAPSGEALLINEDRPDEEIKAINAYHEAGHYVVARIMGFTIKEVNINRDSSVGGQVLLRLPTILKASQIKKLVMVKYAGFLTEKLFNDEAADGCMGCDGADMDRANVLLRKYIILTDDSLSFTGYEDEHIRHKSIELSKLWLQEVDVLLHENKKEIVDIAKILIADAIYVPKV